MPILYWGPWLARIRRGGPANILIQIYGQVVDYFEFQQNFCQKIGRSNTLDSGINLAPGITEVPLLKIFTS